MPSIYRSADIPVFVTWGFSFSGVILSPATHTWDFKKKVFPLHKLYVFPDKNTPCDQNQNCSQILPYKCMRRQEALTEELESENSCCLVNWCMSWKGCMTRKAIYIGFTHTLFCLVFHLCITYITGSTITVSPAWYYYILVGTVSPETKNPGASTTGNRRFSKII